jgi:putative transposase
VGGSVSLPDGELSRFYTGYRHPAKLICHAIWLYFRFPLSLRTVEELLVARGISVICETIW